MGNPSIAPAADEQPATPVPSTMQFGTFLHQHRAAGLNNELTEELQRLVAAVVNQGKKGTLTLTIGVAPSEVDGAIVITDKVVTKTPEPDRDPSLFFSDAAGNISRRDPRQAELPIRDASAD